MSPPWWLIEQSDLGDRLIGERTIASAESPLCLSTGAPATAPPARSTGSFLVIHPCVSRPHSKHSRYSRSGARRIQSSWPMNQHFNDSRRNRKDPCGVWVHIAPATAARTAALSNRERTSRGSLPHKNRSSRRWFQQ